MPTASPSLSWLPTEPPPPPGTVLVAAGVHWDAVRVPWSIARHAVVWLGARGDNESALLTAPLPAGEDDDEPGTRAYLERPVYWLIPPGSGGDWGIPDVRVLSSGDHLAIPPASARHDPHDAHWHRVPVPDQWLADPHALRGALAAAVWDQKHRCGGY